MSWTAMRQRCSSSHHKHFRSYGGRGIDVCERWNSFDNFLADMGPRPDGCTLERLDLNLPYHPDNCIWADSKRQANNKTTNHYMTYLGQTKTLSQWCDELGLPYSTVRARLRSGWSDEAALTRPIKPVKSRRGVPIQLEYMGRRQPLSHWCRELGLSVSTVSCRLKRGVSVADALRTPQQQSATASLDTAAA